MRPGPLRTLVFGAGLLLTGCSSFDSRWQAARKVPSGDPWAGAWEGQWMSSRHTGVQDRLRCILTPIAGGDYRAEFKAKWLKVFSSEHEVVFHTTRVQGGVKSFRGSASLGTWIGNGTYHCEGTLTPRRLTAKYDSSYDVGRFVLGR